MTLSNYTFKGVPKPFEHQIETTKFIVDNPRCFVFNDIGTGKTWSAVWAIDYLMQIGDIRNVLIVAPLSTLEIVWQRTFFYLDASLSVEVLKGTASKRNQRLGRWGMLQDRGIVSIINPDALHIIQDNKDLALYDMILVDESAMFRNAKSRRFKALQKICKDKKRVVMMTGSPCPEAPTDIWSTARIICPERVPKYFGQFRDLTMRKITMFKWIALPNAQETITRLLKDYVIRYRRDECIDLPESQSFTYEVEPTKQQTKAITEMRRAAIALFEDGAVTAPNEAVVVSKILQIASGAVRFTNAESKEIEVKEIDCKSKMDALAEILEASEQPVIIYVPFKAAIKRLEKSLSMSYSVRVVNGDTPIEKRKEAFDGLQSGLVRVLIAHPQAIAHGLSLTNSNVVVWFCPIFSHEIFEQANGRVVRPGQTRKTYFIHLVCSALEKKVLARLNEKSKLQGSLLEYLQRGDV